MDNFFELFELPSSLPVDMSKLTTRYQQLQRQYHPDNFATANSSDKLVTMQKSAMINDGYQTLKNPIKAISYFLSLQGFDIKTDNHIIRDPDFLMEQFALREKLEEIENQADIELLDNFHTEINQRKKDVYDQSLISISEQDWHTALNQLYKIHYFVRLIEQIEKLQEHLDPL